MESFDFRDVRLLLAEPNWQVRSGIKSGLYTLGFRNIQDTDRVERLRSWVAIGAADLLIADLNLPDGATCQLFHEIRHHLVGTNPFLTIIAMTYQTSPRRTRDVLDSGADDLLAKPISTQFLGKRIRNLIEARKPFVVTTDYIGPERCSIIRPGHGPGLVQAPNTLRAKATGEASAEGLQKEIDEVIVQVNERRMEQQVSQLGGLAAQIVAAHRDGQTMAEAESSLQCLLERAQDIARRLGRSRYGHVSDLCVSLIGVTKRLIEDWDRPGNREAELLPELAAAISTAFGMGDAAERAARDITASVSAIASPSSGPLPPGPEGG